MPEQDAPSIKLPHGDKSETFRKAMLIWFTRAESRDLSSRSDMKFLNGLQTHENSDLIWNSIDLDPNCENRALFG